MDNFDPFEEANEPYTSVADAGSYETIITEVNSAISRRRTRSNDARYLKRLRETAVFLQNVAQGRVNDHQLREVMSTSDFPILFGDILDRRLLAQYSETTPVWSQYASRGTVADFRQSRVIALDGMQQPFYPNYKKAELDGVKYDNAVTETPYTTSVEVYEKAFALNWRMLVNRALNFTSRLPTFLARGARRTESKHAVSLFVDSAGPISSFFSVGNGNVVTGNPALSISALEAALNTMYQQVDSGGDPIEIMGVTLVVPPLLKIKAQQILKALTLEYAPATSGAGMRYVTPNWASDINLAVEWYLPVVDQSANKHTTWYLFADPNVGRPALELTFLQGYENPSFWQKAPNTMRMGTSGVDPMMGDFEDMSQHYKGLHILGGTRLDPKGAVASNGSNT